MCDEVTKSDSNRFRGQHQDPDPSHLLKPKRFLVCWASRMTPQALFQLPALHRDRLRILHLVLLQGQLHDPEFRCWHHLRIPEMTCLVQEQSSFSWTTFQSKRP